MKGEGPRHERETIITFNEDDGTADIWTASETVHRRLLKRLGSEAMVEDGERHSRWKCPKKAVLLPRRARVIPEAQLEKLRARNPSLLRARRA